MDARALHCQLAARGPAMLRWLIACMTSGPHGRQQQRLIGSSLETTFRMQNQSKHIGLLKRLVAGLTELCQVCLFVCTLSASQCRSGRARRGDHYKVSNIRMKNMKTESTP